MTGTVTRIERGGTRTSIRLQHMPQIARAELAHDLSGDPFALTAALNESVAIRFDARNAFAGKVIWENGSERGIAFDDDMDAYTLRSMMALDRTSPGIPPRLPQAELSEPGDDGGFHPGLRVMVMSSNGAETPAMITWAST